MTIQKKQWGFVFQVFLFLSFLALASLASSRVFASGNLQPAPINLNTATPKELALLPGLGPKKSAAIVKFREEHGKFQSIEDIRKVKGVGAKLFKKIKNRLTVESGVSGSMAH